MSNSHTTTIHRCDNCGRTYTDQTLPVGLDSVPNLNERLDPGSEVPSGECICGALTHLVKPDAIQRPDAEYSAKKAGTMVMLRVPDFHDPEAGAGINHGLSIRTARRLAAELGTAAACASLSKQEQAKADSPPSPRFRNHYHCPDCNETWEDEWDCMCDDECARCGKPCSPTHSEDL